MTTDTSQWPFSIDAIHGQLERVIGSSEFRVSDRSRDFLRYIVDETLGGRADGLKAYCIGMEVFGRAETFDAQSDPVVRIEAARMRMALERYYFTGGRADRILIDIPKGGYRPTFTLRPALEAAQDAPIPLTRTAGSPRTWSNRGALAALVAGGLLINSAFWLAALATARPNADPPPSGLNRGMLANRLGPQDIEM